MRSQPLSDDRIVELLKGEGVEIARRTVAKYREAMRIPSSAERRGWAAWAWAAACRRPTERRSPRRRSPGRPTRPVAGGKTGLTGSGERAYRATFGAPAFAGPLTCW